MDIKKILAVAVMWGGYGMAADAAGDDFVVVTNKAELDRRLTALEETNTRLFRTLSARSDELGTRTAELKAKGSVLDERMAHHSERIGATAGRVFVLEQSAAALEGAQATTTRQIIELQVADAQLRTRMDDWEARLRVIADQQATLAHRNQAALARHKERLDGHDARLDVVEQQIPTLRGLIQAQHATIAPIPDLQRTVAKLYQQVAGLQAHEQQIATLHDLIQTQGAAIAPIPDLKDTVVRLYQQVAGLQERIATLEAAALSRRQQQDFKDRQLERGVKPPKK